MIRLADLIEGERNRVTTFSDNGDGTITRRLFWQYKDGTEETIKEEIIQENELNQKLQDVFAMNE